MFMFNHLYNSLLVLQRLINAGNACEHNNGVQIFFNLNFFFFFYNPLNYKKNVNTNAYLQYTN